MVDKNVLLYIASGLAFRQLLYPHLVVLIPTELCVALRQIRYGTSRYATLPAVKQYPWEVTVRCMWHVEQASKHNIVSGINQVNCTPTTSSTLNTLHMNYSR